MQYYQANHPTEIPKAFKLKKGALHKSLGIAQGKKISMSTLQKAKHSHDPLTRKRATFAINARKFRHK